MKAIDVERRLAVVASGQWGLVTAPQAMTQGVSYSQLNRLAERNVLDRLSHGVYQLRSAPADRHVDLRAAWLALEPKRTAGQRLQDPTIDAVVSHASAAAFRGWGELTAYDSEFTFDGRKQSRRLGVRFHRGSTPATDVEIVGGLPVTTAERLVADLLTSGYELEHVGAVLASAVRDHVIDLGRLADRVAGQAARRGFGVRSGGELVAALVDAGDAQDEVVADGIVRLSRGDRSGVFDFDPVALGRVRDVAAAAVAAQIDPASFDGVRHVAAAAVSQMDFAPVEQAREAIASNANQLDRMRREVRSIHKLFADPATQRAMDDIRKNV